MGRSWLGTALMLGPVGSETEPAGSRYSGPVGEGKEVGGRRGRLTRSFGWQVIVTAVACGVVGSWLGHTATARVGTAPDARHVARRGPGLPVADFHSMPGFHPPLISVGPDADRRSGDVFLTAQVGPFWAGKHLQNGPMILDSRGRLIWFRPLQGDEFASDLEVQRYRDRPVLTWWQGTSHGGNDVIMNDSYRTVATLGRADGLLPDAHEFQITPQGTAFLNAWTYAPSDLSSVGGPRHGTVIDDVIQERDIRSGRVLWEWHALGHVPISDSYPKPIGSYPYDYFHLNSIQQLPGGNLLISARNTWAVYEISRSTGRVIWTIGGKHPSFRMGAGTGFEWQHDARLAGRRLSLFDDADSPQKEPQSSAMLLRIDPSRMTASLMARYTHSPSLLSAHQGSTQVLPDGNIFVGWGDQPNFSEYSPTGRQIFDGSFPLGIDSYRAFRFLWVGHPSSRPVLAVTRSQDTLTVYASWNGATQAATWRVLAGPSTGQLRAVAQRHRTGFETAITLQQAWHYVAVQALSSTGHVLGTSTPRLAIRPAP
jgi:hypothetical protein